MEVLSPDLDGAGAFNGGFGRSCHRRQTVPEFAWVPARPLRRTGVDSAQRLGSTDFSHFQAFDPLLNCGLQAGPAGGFVAQDDMARTRRRLLLEPVRQAARSASGQWLAHVIDLVGPKDQILTPLFGSNDDLDQLACRR